MKENRYKNADTKDLIIALTNLQNEIGLKAMIYNEMREEIIRRYPEIEKENIFEEIGVNRNAKTK